MLEKGGAGGGGAVIWFLPKRGIVAVGITKVKYRGAKCYVGNSMGYDYTSYVLFFRMVFFYHGTMGWICYISLCESSINQSINQSINGAVVRV